MQNKYILETGKKGAKRLESVQALYGKESENLLKIAGLGKGMNVLDLGCGTGQMTKWIAQEVGAEGAVIALDNSQEQLDIAKIHLDAAGLNNINYLCKNSFEITQNDLQDVELIYIRLVLLHNNNPNGFIRHILKTAPKKTILVIEEPITNESCCYPNNEAFNKHLELYLKLGEVEKFDFNFGQKLVGLLLDEGIFPEGIRKIRCSYNSDIVKLIAYRRTLECAEKYLKWELIENDRLKILLEQLKKLTNQKFLISGVTMVQVWSII